MSDLGVALLRRGAHSATARLIPFTPSGGIATRLFPRGDAREAIEVADGVLRLVREVLDA
jgi:hypothetical protein